VEAASHLGKTVLTMGFAATKTPDPAPAGACKIENAHKCETIGISATLAEVLFCCIFLKKIPCAGRNWRLGRE
jgi:hypothetical protein